MKSRTALLVLIVLLLLGVTWWRRSGTDARTTDASEAVVTEESRPPREPRRAKPTPEDDSAPSLEEEVPAHAQERRANLHGFESGVFPRGTELELPERRLRGRLVDTSGDPLAGREVVLWSTWLPARSVAAVASAGSLPFVLRRMTTGADGAFELAYHEGGDRLLQVYEGGQDRALLRGLSDDRFHEIVLATEWARLEGRVVRADDGRPVAGARVLLRWSVMPGIADGHSPETTTQAIEAGADGSWDVNGVPAGTVHIDIRAQGLAPALDRQVQVPRIGTLELETRLTAGAIVVGSVSDGISGAPITGARVFVTDAGGSLREATESDADGNYRLGPLAADLNSFFSVSALARGYAETQTPVGITSVGQREIGASFELQRSAVIRLRCTAAAGAPLAGVMVTAESQVLRHDVLPADGGGEISITMVHPSDAAGWTDGDGRIELTGLHPGSRGLPLRVVFYRGGVAVHEVEAPELASEEVRELGTVVLTRTHPIRGTIVDESGAPVPGAAVVAVKQGSQGTDLPHVAGEVMAGHGRRGRAGEDGVFQAHGCAPGTWDLYITADGFAATLRRGLEVSADRSPEPVRVSLSRGVRLTGRVLLPGGAPAAGACVMITRNDPLPLHVTESVTTDADGRFEIGGIPAAAHDVEITAFMEGDGETGALMVQRTLDPADGPFDLTLDGGE